MKKRNLHIRSVFAILAMIAVCFSCITIKTVGIPDKLQANDTVEFTVEWDFDAETERNPEYIVFAMLVPKSWGISNNAEVSYSTNNLASQLQYKNDIVNEKMVLMDPSEKEATTGLPYASACNAFRGQAGNYGSMEWVCFKSQTSFATDGSDAAQGVVNVTTKVKFKTGGANIKFNFALQLFGTVKGFYDENGSNAEYSEMYVKTVEVVGGTGYDDFTTPKLVSTTPSEIGYGDIFCFNFSTNVAGAESDLQGESEVYVMGTATLASGKTVTLSTKGKQNLMETSDKTQFSKYVYLPQLFNISPSDKIENLVVWFENKAGDKIEKGGEGDGFIVSKAN